jgi:hypothetical protein
MKKVGFTLFFAFVSIVSNADSLIDDFNSARTYGVCCGEFGAYGGFVSNVTQTGSGTVVVAGTAVNEGGFYHAGLGTILWDFSTQTGLVVRVRAGAANQTSLFWIFFQDLYSRRLAFSFPLNNTNFTTLSKNLTEPDFADEGFSLWSVVSVDVCGDYNQTNTTVLQLELDEINVLGPPVEPRIRISSAGTNVVLTWRTNSEAVLQSTVAVPGGWSNDVVAAVVGTNYQVTKPVSGTRFFRLLISSNAGQGLWRYSSVDDQKQRRWPNGKGANQETNPAVAAIVLPPSTIYTNTFLDVSSFTESWRYYYNGGPNDFLYETTGSTTWNAHTGGTWTRHVLYEEPPGTVVDDYDETVQLTSTNPAPQLQLVYAKFNFSEEDAIGDYRRNDQTMLHLHTARCIGVRQFQFVLLSATANKAGGAFDDQFPWRPLIVISNAISFDKISLLGQPLNADNHTLLQCGCNQTLDATPAINESNYVFSVALSAPKSVPLTWVYNQRFHAPTNRVPTLSDWQAKFDSGSMVLATDDDDKIRDGDPSVASSTNATSLYRKDDVPVYVEFPLSYGPSNFCVFTRTQMPVLPTDPFGPVRYFNVTTLMDMDELADWTVANLKIIKSINVTSFGAAFGYARLSLQPASIVLTESASDITCVHEWGHSCGLRHRGDVDANGVPLNPGPILDAVMGFGTTVFPRTEVNRFERDAMNAYGL